MAVTIAVLTVDGNDDVGEEEIECSGYDSWDEKALGCSSARCDGLTFRGRWYLYYVDEARHDSKRCLIVAGAVYEGRYQWSHA